MSDVEKRDALAKAENELFKQLQRIVGYIPGGSKDMLHCLLHPDVIELTEDYIRKWKAVEK